jgi:4-oxalocrotonate tautomerase
MKNEFSRREFMVRGSVGLGAALALGWGGFAAPGTMRVAGALASEGEKEIGMPHVSVKLWPGRSEEDKKRLADAITEDVVRITGCSASSVSVTIEDVDSGDWKEKVYDPLIRDKSGHLYKKPGYSM